MLKKIPRNILILVTIAAILFSGMKIVKPVFAEGQLIESKMLNTEESKIEKEEIVTQIAGKVKKDVIARKFKSVNSNLENYAASKFSEYVMEASAAFQIDPFLIASILIKESHAKYKARSSCGAYGLMQVNWSVHRGNIRKAFSEIATLSDLIQPRNNILVGTYIFSCYMQSSGGDISEALSRYLGASGRRYIAGVMKYHSQMVDSYSNMMEVMLKRELTDTTA